MFDSRALCRVLYEDIGLPAGAGFAVAYSGGCDSQVLLHALRTARRELDFDFELTALHFDHGLSPQSAAWARQCEARCREWGIDFLGERQGPVSPSPSLPPPVPERGGTEALARRRRYRWFARVVQPGQVLLTAHHADDQAETVLLNLLRGGGVEALAGIPRRRILSAEKSTLVARPLLPFPRKLLAEYARRHQLSWIEDPANQSPEFDRNYLRKSVLPLLQNRWPSATASLGRAAENCRDAAGFLDESARRLLPHCQAAEKRGVFCLAPPLAVSALQPLGRFQTLNLIRHWIHQQGRRSPSAGQLATLFAQVFEAHCARAGLRWADAELRCFGGHIYLTARLDPSPGAARQWALRDCPLALDKNRLRLEARASADGGLDPRRLCGKSARLVWRAGGERMTLPGRKHSSALKKLFQQNAVPPWERGALPLLVVDGEVAWAHGVGAGAVCCAGEGPGIRLRFVAGGD